MASVTFPLAGWGDFGARIGDIPSARRPFFSSGVINIEEIFPIGESETFIYFSAVLCEDRTCFHFCSMHHRISRQRCIDMGRFFDLAIFLEGFSWEKEPSVATRWFFWERN